MYFDMMNGPVPVAWVDVIVVAVLLDRRGTRDVAGELPGKKGVGVLRLDLERVIVHRAERVDWEQAIRRAAGAHGVVILEVLIQQSIELELHGLGVEVGAIMELDALAQIEGPRQLVRAHRPLCRQRRTWDRAGV